MTGRARSGLARGPARRASAGSASMEGEQHHRACSDPHGLRLGLARARRPVRAFRRAARDVSMRPARRCTTIWRRCGKIGDELGIGFLGLGADADCGRGRRSPVMPKGRYAIMAPYMDKMGGYGRDMMFRSCTVQVNLDFGSEADMVKKLRVSLALQPIATALFANSPFLEGKPNGFQSFRSEVWLDTDPDRTGMLPFAFEPGFGLRALCRLCARRADVFRGYRDGPLHQLRRRKLSRFHGGKAAAAAGRAADPEGLGRSPDDDLPGGSAQALSRDARRRFRSVAAAVRAAGPVDRRAL